jgi:hypothetical protein
VAKTRCGLDSRIYGITEETNFGRGSTIMFQIVVPEEHGSNLGRDIGEIEEC